MTGEAGSPYIGVMGYMHTREVYINGKRLDPEPSQLQINHSPDGFNWGYGGSGPAQLALAILMAYNVPIEKARSGHHELMWDVIAHLPSGDFLLPEMEVRIWIKSRLAIDI